jgi:hypothetical protein
MDRAMQIELASKRLSELKAVLAIYDATSELVGLYQDEAEEIEAFLIAVSETENEETQEKFPGNSDE